MALPRHFPRPSHSRRRNPDQALDRRHRTHRRRAQRRMQAGIGTGYDSSSENLTICTGNITAHILQFKARIETGWIKKGNSIIGI
jgi:hypothetical protein